MKHSGRAQQAALKLIFITLLALAGIFIAGAVVIFFASLVKPILIILLALWAIFAIFTFYFFRDPDPNVPTGAGLVLSPGHGKVDMIDQLDEPKFVGGRCQRISIFLSVIDIHVQNAPVSGKITCVKHTSGQFLSALKTESAEHNENVLIGIESTERAGLKIGVRLIAGVLARRIVPFVNEGDET